MRNVLVVTVIALLAACGSEEEKTAGKASITAEASEVSGFIQSIEENDAAIKKAKAERMAELEAGCKQFGLDC